MNDPKGDARLGLAWHDQLRWEMPPFLDPQHVGQQITRQPAHRTQIRGHRRGNDREGLRENPVRQIGAKPEGGGHDILWLTDEPL
jgi:hypothetical protein